MKKALITATITAAAAAGILFGATPAQAQTHGGDAWRACARDMVCLYVDTHGRGGFANSARPNKHYIPGWINDKTSSIWNRSESTICFYQDAGAQGPMLIKLGPGEWVRNVGKAANDKISSYGPCD